METITISPKGVLDASIGLQSTGIDYFVDGGQGRESKKLIHAEKRKKDSLQARNRPIVRQNTFDEGQAVRGIHWRGRRKDSTTYGDDISCITALFWSLHIASPHRRHCRLHESWCK